jgi:tRNA threonylcarbamoyladenosine biosynthesis protein TsaE
MVRWIACLSAWAKTWPPGENARSAGGQVCSSLLRSAACRYRRSETVWSVSSRIGAGSCCRRRSSRTTVLTCWFRWGAGSLISPSISSAPIPTLGDSVVCLLAHRRWELLSACAAGRVRSSLLRSAARRYRRSETLRWPLVSVSVSDLVVSIASPHDAAAMVEVIHSAFAARPPIDPPSSAIDETAETLAASLQHGAGIFARVGGRPAGVIVVLPGSDGVATFSRVSVHPDLQRHGIASAMVTAAEELAAIRGFQRVELFTRAEFPEFLGFWQHRGFVVERVVPHGMILTKLLPLVIKVPTSADMVRLGERLARLLESGDVIIAGGDLGAGKTTLTQGIGRGLGSEGPIISPTFVLSRIHPSAIGRPTLMHVDAYRLSSSYELDDLDLDAAVADAVTVVEWGQGIAEGLSEDRLEIDVWTSPADVSAVGDDSERLVTVRGVGARWRGVDLGVLRDHDH